MGLGREGGEGGEGGGSERVVFIQGEKEGAGQRQGEKGFGPIVLSIFFRGFYLVRVV